MKDTAEKGSNTRRNRGVSDIKRPVRINRSGGLFLIPPFKIEL